MTRRFPRPASLPGIALAATALLACSAPSRFVRGGGGGVQPLVVQAIQWNPAHTEVGHVAAVADVDDDVVVFGDQGAVFFTAGTMVAADRRISAWRGAAALPAADRQGTWLTGIDAAGLLHRARARSTLELISDRYGLADRQINAATALGGGLVGLAIAAPTIAGLGVTSEAGPQLALVDGPTVVSYGHGPTGELAGGGGKAAWIDGPLVRVFDPGKRNGNADRLFSLPGVLRVALDAKGRLHAATRHELYAEDTTGSLLLVYETATSETSISGLVSSGSRVWFSDGGDLGLVEGSRVAVTSALGRPEAARLAPSPSGDVWSLAGGGLSRFAPADSLSARRARWSEAIRPAFERACASCHGASPSSGSDLSTFAAWESRRAAVRERVIELRDMPPRGHALDDESRNAIDAWTAVGSPSAR